MSVRTSPDSYREKTKNKGQEETSQPLFFGTQDWTRTSTPYGTAT